MCPCTDREEARGVPGGQVPGTSEEEIDPTRNQSGRGSQGCLELKGEKTLT